MPGFHGRASEPGGDLVGRAHYGAAAFVALRIPVWQVDPMRADSAFGRSAGYS